MNNRWKCAAATFAFGRRGGAGRNGARRASASANGQIARSQGCTKEEHVEPRALRSWTAPLVITGWSVRGRNVSSELKQR